MRRWWSSGLGDGSPGQGERECILKQVRDEIRRYTHRRARTHDHKVKRLALYRLSSAGLVGSLQDTTRASHGAGLFLARVVLHPGRSPALLLEKKRICHFSCVTPWPIMTRTSAQAGNRASKTVRRSQWWDGEPEW